MTDYGMRVFNQKQLINWEGGPNKLLDRDMVMAIPSAFSMIVCKSCYLVESDHLETPRILLNEGKNP